ncbi:LacI family transcriptional regulator [Vibrio inusitatus NBRC 102082]|uniref:LacI family transcriptional regulator n=1 Tax=Vibrio inusitatus NBRC 102082 TaxID=1219070 RepID=A0A4Y3HYN0_9VIBR|nr:LacI family DNA-binding transcriptional regulator [Vibrio inusitatus]GEA52118.1 LacI family transcriptional regulator [Vibrio inusitatus NBRC 102082]
MKKTTLDDIAKLSGVSKTTVSRVLNSSSQVSDTIRQKVEAVLEDSGYQKKPQKMEFSLDFRKITIISDEEDVSTPSSFFSSIVDGLKHEANKLELQIEWILKNQIKTPSVLEERLNNSEAVIMLGMENYELLHQIQKHNLPVVIMNGVDQEMKVSSISPDYELGAYMATRELYKHNHRNIKIMTAEIKHSIYDRTDGFRRALLTSGLQFDYAKNVLDIVQRADEVDPSGRLQASIRSRSAGMDFGARQILPYLIEQGEFDDCTAVFCICDMMAISLIDELSARGIRVPEDISVIGFDDIEIASMTNPPLTTISTNYRTLAASTIHLLIQSARDKHSLPIRSNLGVELIERGSICNLETSEQ